MHSQNDFKVLELGPRKVRSLKKLAKLTLLMKPFWFGKVRISTTLTIWNLIKNKHVNYRRHDAEENIRDLVKIGTARL